MSITKKLLQMDAKRLFALAIGPGLLALGVDAWISHFVGKEGEGLQWVPVIFAPLGMLVALAWGAVRMNPRAFRWGLTLLGLSCAVVGLWGTGLHVQVIWADLADETFNWASIQGALGSGPPLFAPMAFAGVGGLIALIAQPLLELRLNRGNQTAPLVSAPVVVVGGAAAEAPSRKAA